jgi:predicted O-linked N-acetylglucosamine transferase (SPINDLY family)
MTAPPGSRNDPCPCGSGLRYKHCHGAPGAAPSATAPAEAEAAWRRALEIDPGNAEARFHLGNLFRERGEAHAAIVEYELALASAPGHPGLRNNLGLALEAAGDRQRAEACYRQVLAAEPGQPDALGNLANVQFERGDFPGAAAAYTRLFALRRDIPAAILVRRGIVQHKIRALDAAEASFRQAARLAPDDHRVQFNLALVLTDRQRFADAEPALLRTLALEPRHRSALCLLARTRQHLCAWDGIESLFSEIGGLLDDEHETGTGINPFSVLAMPLSPRAQLRAAQRWSAGFAPPLPALRPDVQLAAGERLRVGFVSTDFREHPMVHVSLEFWERIDRHRIETFAYAIEPEDKGPFGQRAARAFEHFADISGESTPAIVQRIRNDRIAILIDLNGDTKNARPQIFAQRPAPIQLNFLGFPGTLGAPWYDYIVADAFGAPLSMQWAYAERLLHLPHCSYPSDTRRAPRGPAPSRAECGLPETGFVFCCFNNAYKILPDVFAIWMRLLAAAPGSCLWLFDAADEARQNLRREARRAGVAGERLLFAPRAALAAHLARIAAADLVIDTFPYGAHTTANDALLAGVPVLTCAGETLASRIAGSQLHAIGLPELVTSSFTDYEALALRLARHPAELAALRGRLAANRHTHPLFDMARYTRDYEDALLRIWQEHTGAPPSG